VTDSIAVVRNILLHIAAGVLLPDTPPAAEAILIEEVTEVLGEMVLPDSNDNDNDNDNNARHDPPL
jgi:hypothetical protein